MCGIYASISTGGFRPPSNDLSSLLCNRGPDHLGETQTEVLDDGKTYSLSFTSTVLALRGGNVQVQPFVDDETGSVLCWNGEAWKIESEHISGNDGQKLFDALIQASIQKTPEIAILDVLRSVSGPFAFVFLDKIHGQVYFGRDRLGRRSLLYNTESIPKCVEFASTSRPGDNCWKEVEADAIYQVSFRAQSALQDPSDHLLATSLYSLQRQTWVSSDAKSAVSTSPELEPSASSSLQDGFHNANWGQLPATATFNRSVPNNNDVLTFQSASVKLLKEHLRESLKFRILNVPVPPRLHERSAKVCMAILFSGGLDCTVLARMAHDLLPSDQQIDLLNVAFENPRVVQAAKAPPMKSKKRNKNSQSPSNVAEIEEDKAVAVLTQLTTILSPYESCPDRETGRKSFQELQKVCPGRVWRFVAVNIPYSETIAHREKIINLIHPHNTEMDLSIACALYFASRGSGLATSSLNTIPETYECPARVLLSGLGADELFGGYTRHATAFNRNGFSGLLDELELDVNRLGKRNLGRDDRVISHWGREARFPYLDESLVKWAVECPIWEKCGFQNSTTEPAEEPDIEPGKKVLRLLAYDLGMHSVAKRRREQFNSEQERRKWKLAEQKAQT